METNSSNAAENRLQDISEQQQQQSGSSVTSAPVGNVNRIPVRVTSMHTGNSKLGINTTPRIDISRASSTSQQGDSRDSSPDNVFDQVLRITISILVLSSITSFSVSVFNHLIQHIALV